MHGPVLELTPPPVINLDDIHASGCSILYPGPTQSNPYRRPVAHCCHGDVVMLRWSPNRGRDYDRKSSLVSSYWQTTSKIAHDPAASRHCLVYDGSAMPARRYTERVSHRGPKVSHMRPPRWAPLTNICEIVGRWSTSTHATTDKLNVNTPARSTPPRTPGKTAKIACFRVRGVIVANMMTNKTTAPQCTTPCAPPARPLEGYVQTGC